MCYFIILYILLRILLRISIYNRSSKHLILWTIYYYWCLFITHMIFYIYSRTILFAHPFIDSTGKTNSFLPYKNLKKLGLKNNIFIFIAFAILLCGLSYIFCIILTEIIWSALDRKSVV